MKVLQCCADATLRAYQDGTVEPELIDSVAEHLRTCSTCLSRLHELEPADDPLLLALRRQQAAGDQFNDPIMAAAVARVLSDAAGEAPTDGQLGVGSVLHEYRLLEKLGSGGMGTVYRALHVRLEKEVALKIIHPLRGHDAQLRRRFQREMKAIGKLRHPQIVLATDAGESQGVLYLVMELERGSDLADYVRQQGRLPVAEACSYALQAALGLQCAHEAGLVHRDVKPSNLFRTESGQVKLLDLGLARLVLSESPPHPDEASPAIDTKGDSTPTCIDETASAMGTDDYMAPEQWCDAHHADARSDLYSLGCTLFFLLTGRAPFASPTATTRAQVRHLHLREPPPGLRTLRSDAPPRLEALVNRLLAKRPEERFTSAAEVAHELSAWVKPRPRWGRRAAATVLLLSGIIAMTMALNRPRDDISTRAGNLPVEAPKKKPKVPPPRGALPMTPVEAKQLQQQWRNHLDRPAVYTNPRGMEFALIPPGEFLNFNHCYLMIENPYYLGASEVTMSQFRRFVNATSYKTEAETSGKGSTVMNFQNSGKNKQGPATSWFFPEFKVESQECPVVHVSWNDAIAFCDWLSREGGTYRLPTTAEWTWACRAGYAGERYPVDKPSLAEPEWIMENSENHPRTVKQHPPNPWGLYDMFGNVSEWMLDQPDLMRTGKVIDVATKAEGQFRTNGGTSYNSSGTTLRVPSKDLPPTHRSSAVGFRIVYEIPSQSGDSR